MRGRGMIKDAVSLVNQTYLKEEEISESVFLLTSGFFSISSSKLSLLMHKSRVFVSAVAVYGEVEYRRHAVSPKKAPFPRF